MKPKPSNLTESIKWTLALMPVTADADAETKAVHRELRKIFEMNPDISQRGDAADYRTMSDVELLDAYISNEDEATYEAIEDEIANRLDEVPRGADQDDWITYVSVAERSVTHPAHARVLRRRLA
jgi:hypothetical protein